MMKIYAKAMTIPAGTSYLTEGKLYETYTVGSDGYDGDPGGFHILDDDNDELFCLWEGCDFLADGNWERIEKEEPSK
jgi:hypothetical protein